MRYLLSSTWEQPPSIFLTPFLHPSYILLLPPYILRLSFVDRSFSQHKNLWGPSDLIDLTCDGEVRMRADGGVFHRQSSRHHSAKLLRVWHGHSFRLRQQTKRLTHGATFYFGHSVNFGTVFVLPLRTWMSSSPSSLETACWLRAAIFL